MSGTVRVPTITSIKLTNVTNRGYAQPLIDALQGKSYMDLQVALCPIGGSFDVNITTMRPETSEQELTEMVLMIMSSTVMTLHARRPTIQE
jgi:hypothetical protein